MKTQSLDNKPDMSRLEKEFGKSVPKKTKNILRKYNKLLGTYKKLAKFEEPVMILMRRSGKCEWFEAVTQGVYTFTRSDGKEGKIWLNQKFLQTMDYGDNPFRLYVCHEDHPFPLPQDPLIYGDQLELLIDRVMQVAEKHRNHGKTNEGTWWAIAKAIALIIGVIGGIIIIAGFFHVDLPFIGQSATSVAQNISTNISQNMTIGVIT